MLRSEDMDFYSVVFTQENAWEILDNFGQMGIIQFHDQNQDLLGNHRNHFHQIQELKQNLVKLAKIEKNLIQWDLLDSKITFEEQKTQTCLQVLQSKLKKKNLYQYYNQKFLHLQKDFDSLQKNLSNYQILQNKIDEAVDYLNVLEALEQRLPKSFNINSDQKFQQQMGLDYLIGVVNNEDLLKLQKTIFRISRGNIYSIYLPVKPVENSFYRKQNLNKKIVFLTFQSTNSNIIKDKIERLFENLGLRTFQIPQDYKKLTDERVKASADNYEADKILRTTYYEIQESLEDFIEFLPNSKISYLYYLKVIFLKKIFFYENIDKLKAKNQFYEGEFWLPRKFKDKFNEIVKKLESEKSFAGLRIIETDESQLQKVPPTFFDVNGFTEPFQEIIDTYGIPRYKEVNPGFFAIVWFPYMFGTMFGDAGHGLSLLTLALFLLFKPKSFPFALRKYSALLIYLGFFAFYCGLIYNDFLSIPLPLSKSCYSQKNDEFVKTGNCPYKMGIDYNWHLSANSITFVNSFKMKISILIGVIHMTIGIILKGMNSIQFKELAVFFFEFLPQLIFFLSTFGYMCFCIVVKWFNNYDGITEKAPSIISLYINFVQKVDYPLYANEAVQLHVQRILAIIAVVCIPTMFFVKPILKNLPKKKHKKKHQETDEEYISLIEKEEIQSQNSTRIEEKEEHGLGEDLVHQAIETIEFVLGSISNTASYLRLWALSLAHSQLAEVFLNMLIRPYFMGGGNPLVDALILVIMFIVFFMVSVGVLMIMSMMECLLHALRLQWVEFQNKFYKGDGIKFEKFKYQKFIDESFTDFDVINNQFRVFYFNEFKKFQIENLEFLISQTKLEVKQINQGFF